MTAGQNGPLWLGEKSTAALAPVRQLRDSNLYPYFRPFESGSIRTTVDGHSFVNFSSNDYLGLTNHAAVVAAAHEALDRFACGLSSSRLQANTSAHVALEERLARFFGFQRALITTTGYQAVLSVISTLADAQTTLAVDSLAHASILDGAFIAAGTPGRQAEIRFFNHNSPRALDRVLTSRERPHAVVLVEGVYSLDGDVCNLAGLLAVCERHDALLVVDDAHGSGTLGDHGRGSLEHLGVEGRVPIMVTTFSKSFGAIGGAILGSEAVVDMITHQARAFLFSVSLPVPLVAAASVALGLLESDGPQLVEELHAKATYMRKQLIGRGFDLGNSQTQIQPVMVRDEQKVFATHQRLYERGMYLVPIGYPGVKRGEERLRLNVTRCHTYEELDTLAGELADCRDELGWG